jgi:DNA gyrase/topoisomerase IV subunit A
MDVDKMKNAAINIVSLLEKPEYGLYTWNIILDRAVTDLNDGYKDQ